jgi:hypothetical protein
MQTQTANFSTFDSRRVPPSEGQLPWYCYSIVLGAVCIPVGALWDISWHSTIGRDTFWTPAHMLIYLGGLLPGLSAAMAIYHSTFITNSIERCASVGLLGLRGPIGAWVTAWGAAAMLVSAPFDNWWHNAYGLDVEILSPPHTLLALGMYSVAVGALLLVLSWQNRLNGPAQRMCSRLFLLTAGVLLTMSTIIVTEKSFPNQQHGALFYQASAAIYPLYLVIAARASKVRWSATITASIYMGIKLLIIWILPLFPASPRLAPIYNPVTHMVATGFPLLLILPALLIDCVIQALGAKGLKSGGSRLTDWWLGPVIGIIFMGVFIAVQWYFAEFLLTPAARNWFFGADMQWPYWVKLNDWRFKYWNPDRDALTEGALAASVLLAIVNCRLALWAGQWMTAVRR